jgi:diguanylate cyclase (GGDEF)-like protein/PAS domain S-box-containing protein
MNPPVDNAVPLRQSLRVRVGLLVCGAVLVVAGGFVGLGFGPLAERIAASHFATATTRLQAELDLAFSPANRLLEMADAWLARTPPAIDDPDAFNHLFEPVLRALPKATSVVAGDNEGRGWMLLELPDGGWRNRLTDRARWGERQRFLERDAAGHSREYWQELDYDPRRRDWYRAAQAGDGIRWTAPYILFTTGDPGITAARRISLDDGRQLVLGIDLMLRDLSATTMQARVGEHGLALVLTEDLRVLALPAAAATVPAQAWLAKVLKPAGELGLPALDRALAEWRERPFDNVRRVAGEDGGWFVRIVDYRLGDQTLHLVTLAPCADFAPDWLSAGGIAAAGLLAMLALAALVVRQQARRVARPLEELAAASSRIGQLDFTPPSLVRSSISEIRQLAAAHDGMRRLLQQNHAQITAQADELRQQIAALRQAEEKVRDSEAYNKLLFSDSRIPLVVLDPERGCFIDCNQAAADIYRYGDRHKVIGLRPADVSAPYQSDGRASPAAIDEKIRSALACGSLVFEWRHRRPDGERWEAEVHLMAFHHGPRQLLQFSLQDITDRKKAAQALEHLALYDPLTELPNRALFLDRLQQAQGLATRNEGKVAVLFLDLDRFKEVNDTQGHEVGDAVLREVARRFRHVLRQNELLARLGGDEFAVVAPTVEHAGAAYIADRLAHALDAPIAAAGHVFSLGVSIGIAVHPNDGGTPDELLRNADIAMYRAKGGAQRYMFYDPGMSSGLAERIALARDLKAALQDGDGQLALAFQPQFDLACNRLVGAEALLRWQHPQQGAISPGVFIPIAEERGMMPLLSTWVIDAACRQLQAWQAAGLAFPGRLSINIAAQQVEDATFPKQAGERIAQHGLTPARFELELTESGMMRNIDLAIELANQLSAAGFSLAIDDFGTGYSSLAYLKRLPADKLKIDQSFVRDMLVDRNDHAIVATVIAMGRTLGLRTIAEGIETAEQAAALLELGCQEGQGYLLGRPVSATVFAERWLR